MSNHRVKAARERAGLSWAQIVLHRPDLASIEGTAELTDEQVAVAAKAYSVSECWLRGHTGQETGGLYELCRGSAVTHRDTMELIGFAESLGYCLECLHSWPSCDTMGAKGQFNE